MSEKKLTNEITTEVEDLERLVTVIVPRDTSQKKSKTMTLNLNGKSITIPRGVACEVPYKYKLILDKKAQLRQMDDDYKDELEAALKEQP